jgi:hypothetical protein
LVRFADGTFGDVRRGDAGALREEACFRDFGDFSGFDLGRAFLVGEVLLAFCVFFPFELLYIGLKVDVLFFVLNNGFPFSSAPLRVLLVLMSESQKRALLFSSSVVGVTVLPLKSNGSLLGAMENHGSESNVYNTTTYF